MNNDTLTNSSSSSLLKNLNESQQRAVLSENKRLLVLAGAGSGKTKTLIQKVLYLITEKKVKPSNIMAITFTKNAANEMLDRLIISGDSTNSYEQIINNKFLDSEQKDQARRNHIQSKPWIGNLTVRTFHSLCYKIIKEAGGASFDNRFRLLLDETTDDELKDENSTIAPESHFDILHKIIIEECKNVTYLLKLKRYILDYYVDKVNLTKQIKGNSYPDQTYYTTLRGEKVRSKSERDIADWLFRHNIKYEYEPQVNFKDFPFKPDFHIPQANLYLEHVSSLSYKTADKEKQFEIAGRCCVQTYESMTKDSNLFNLALERIVMGKITDSISQLAALKYEEEFASYGDKVKEFRSMVSRMQSMVKGEGVSLEEIVAKSASHQHERVRVFYELAIPIIRKYNEYCINKSYLDFDDLIIQSIKLLNDNPEIRQYYHEKYKHILVDEFQDVNHLQVKLLDLLLTNETNLFCVGDDWQSIYGFRGSEVDYIINFERHFNNSEVLVLDVNYRSTANIVEASNEVIRKNKHQIDKEIKAFKQTPNKIRVFKGKDSNDTADFMVKEVARLLSSGIKPEEILVLYRRTKMYQPYRIALKSAGLRVTPRTIHASKGLEAKVVFIVGLTEGYGGFPDVWLDDAIFRVIKDVKRDMLLEEERRLFYVALTRAKDELYLITELGNESSFLDDIPEEFYSMKSSDFKSVVKEIEVCSSCKTEILEFYKFCPTCGRGI